MWIVNAIIKRRAKLGDGLGMELQLHVLIMAFSLMAGLFVFDDQSGDGPCVIDTFNLVSYNNTRDIIQKWSVDFSWLHECCEYGLAVPDRTLVKIMGKQGLGQYLRSREIHCDQFRFRQFSSNNFPLHGLNEVLRSANEPELCERDFHLQRFQLRSEKVQVQVQVQAFKVVVKVLSGTIEQKLKVVAQLRQSVRELVEDVVRVLME